MAVSASQARLDQPKLPDGASTPPTLQPASLSFKDLQSICGKPIEFKEIPVKESRSANILACYGFPGLRRHKSDDEDGWEHLPHDLLVAIVKHLEPRDAKGMHRVCLSWHLAVRCGLQSMHPAPKITPFPDIRDYFPRVNTLHLLNFTLKAKHLVQLATIARLQHLSLDNVTLEARNSIQKLTSLQALRSLEMINVVGAYPTETEEFLGGMHGLTRLVVCNNTAAVKMAPMHCLASMPLLQELTLSETLHCVLPGLAGLSALTDLKSLRLTKVGVTTGVLRGLGGLTKLNTLHIADAYRVTNAGLEFISRLTGLTHLDFCSHSSRRDEDITDEGAEALAGMTALRSLNLSGHKEITTQGLAFLADCTALTSLDLSDTGLAAGGCEFLAGMGQLQMLSLARTRLEHDSLTHIMGGLTTLTTLSLAWCGVSDETCAELAKLVHMTRLDLRYCPLTNAGMAQLSQAMPRLEYCNVEGCKLTCLGMLALLRQHKGLRVWGPEQNDLHRFMNVADALLICHQAPGQRRLRVSHFPEASRGLTALVGCGVASFFILYFGLLLLFFTALFMFPILMLGCIFVACCLAILGVRYTVRNLRRVWLRCDFAFSTFLLGQHAPAVAQHDHENPHGFIEV